ncbi:unnamed protein product, partial [Choristocarpus tenellus]
MMSAKYYKINHHRIPVLQRYSVTVWVDACFIISAPDFVQRSVAFLNEEAADFAVFRHAHASNVAEDAVRAYALAHKYRGQLVLQQEARYTEEGFPDDQGLLAGGFLVRLGSSSRVSLAMDLWWREIQSGSFQDQISLPYVRWKQPDFRIRVLEEDIYSLAGMGRHIGHAR